MSIRSFKAPTHHPHTHPNMKTITIVTSTLALLAASVAADTTLKFTV
jgi:hypothetical protein